jgi:hypothetical protein
MFVNRADCDGSFRQAGEHYSSCKGRQSAAENLTSLSAVCEDEGLRNLLCSVGILVKNYKEVRGVAADQ